MSQGFFLGAMTNVYLTDKFGFGKVGVHCAVTALRTLTECVGLGLW